MIKRGSLGEVSVIKELMKLGYEVFTPFSENTKYDLVASNGGNLYRVEVKTTTVQKKSGRWEVQIKSVRSNKNKNVIKHFDKSSVDLLCVYIEPEDRVVVIPSSQVTTKSIITVD